MRKAAASFVGVVLYLLVATPADAQSQCKKAVRRFADAPTPLAISPDYLAELRATKRSDSEGDIRRFLFTPGRVPLVAIGDDEYPLMIVDPAEYLPTADEYDESQQQAEDANLPEQPPARVDRTAQQTRIKNQSRRNSCVAFASIAALETHAAVPDDLSEQLGYHRLMASRGDECCDNAGYTTIKAPCVQRRHGIVEEDAWKYTTAVPACGHKVPPTAQSGKKFGVHGFNTIWAAGGTASFRDPQHIERVLAAGHDIVGAFYIVPSFRNEQNGRIDVVIETTTNLPQGYDPDTGKPRKNLGSHAMLIVGYDRPNKTLILKNSWDTKFGHSGYAHISYDYLRTYGIGGYYLLSAGELP